MKKNLRVVLLLALIVLMLGLCALAVSADPEPGDGDYFQVLDATGAHVGYYATPANAVAAVTADGYTVKLIKDVTLTANANFNANFTYTVDGDGHAINYTGVSKPARVTGLTFSAGNVTLKNFTLKTTHNDLKSLVNFTNASSLTFEDMTLEGGGVQIVYGGAGNITFKGTGNVIGKNNNALATSAISIKNASAGGTMTIEGGQFLAGSTLFEASGATIIVKGGTFTKTTNVFSMVDNTLVSAVKIEGGTFDFSAGGALFDYTGRGDCAGFHDIGDAVINVTGGTFIHAKRGNLYNITATTVVNSGRENSMYAITSAGGTATPYPVIRVSGGDVDGWPDEDEYQSGVKLTSQDVGIGTINDDIFCLNATPTKLYITGGTFKGSPFTYSLIEAKGSDSASEINITGGTFIGAQAWIRARNATVWNISGECVFKEPAVQTYKLDQIVYDFAQTDVRPIWVTNESGRTYVLDAESQGKAEKTERDENGDPIMVPQKDGDGNIVYQVDGEGNFIYETDDDGNIVYETDKYGNIIYQKDENSKQYVLDANGNKIPVPKKIPVMTESKIKAKDGDVVGYGRSVAGQLNITGGTFTVEYGESPCMFSMAGADLNISGGTFNIGTRGFQMSDGTSISYVYISGGSFIGSGNGEIIYYAGSNGYNNEGDPGAKYGQRGLIEISGGYFESAEKSTAIWYESSHVKRSTVEGRYDGYVHITGGQFVSNGVYLVRLPNAASGEFLIEGGTFEGTASRFISLSGPKGYFGIKGGTFRLSPMSAGVEAGRTDALVYIKTSRVTTVNIEGGTFINDREGASQLVLFDSRTALLNITGGTFLSRYEIANFLEREFNHGNMPCNTNILPKTTIEGVEYYTAIVHPASDVNAPELDIDVTIRLDAETPGIRFTSYMTKAKQTALLEAGATNLTYGTLIVPENYLLQITDFSGDVLGQLKAIAQAAGVAESKVYADVVADAGTTTDDDGNLTFRAALVGITDVNKAYGAISYVKAKINGQDVYYYSGINTASNIATLKTVIVRELGDVTDLVTEIGRGQYVYKYGSINDDGFSRFTKDEQNYMRRLAIGSK